MDRTVIDRLCAVAGRGGCTDAERRAAAALHDELRARGEEAFVEARWIRPQRLASIAVHAAVAVVAALASVALPVPAAAVAGAAALSLALEAAGRTPPLALLAPRRATQHVLTVPEAKRVTLLVTAGYDAPREPTGLARRLARVRGRLAAWLAGAAAVVAAASALRALGVDGTWLGVIELLATVVLLAGAAGAWDARARPWTAGAGRAAGTALALALLAELRRDPPRTLAPALLLVGAREAGPQGLRAHLRADRARAADTVVLELGPFGAARPAWGARHAQLRAAGARATEALGLTAADRAPRPPRGARRLPAIAIASPGAAATAPEEVADDVLETALDLALAVVDALDAELARVPA